MVPLNIVDGEREYVTKKLFGALLIHKFVYEKIVYMNIHLQMIMI